MEKIIEARGLKLKIAPEVYTPREDSFMMADLLIKEEFDRSFFMEIGPGSGIISLSIAKTSSTILAVDINPIACRQTLDNAVTNKFDNVLSICSDRVAPFRKGALPSVLIFNPPYLPEDPEIDPYSPVHENQQLVGGKRGDETISTMVNEIKENMVIYTIISSLAINPVEFSREHPTWKIRVLEGKNMGFETIWVIKMEPKQ